MGRIRKCSSRCHGAKGAKCHCWCQGFFHGVNGSGAINRAALAGGMIDLKNFPGYKKGKTAYIEQLTLKEVQDHGK